MRAYFFTGYTKKLVQNRKITLPFNRHTTQTSPTRAKLERQIMYVICFKDRKKRKGKGKRKKRKEGKEKGKKEKKKEERKKVGSFRFF